MMDIQAPWPWLALLLLGSWHGINPGMGWLFAVALGLQEQKRRAVWRALLPLALGHGLAVAAAILVGVLAGLVLPVKYLKWLVAAALLGFGLYRLARHRHPRWGGMRVGMWDLTVWSLLMASAHGAGLMVLPFVVGTTISPGVASNNLLAPVGHHEAPTIVASAHAAPLVGSGSPEAVCHPGAHGAVASPGPSPSREAEAGHAAHTGPLLSGLTDGRLVGLAATLLHTLGYLLVMGLVAVIVYERLGLRLLRSMWFNLDLVWAAALILTGLLTPLI
jgi:hypothetical protein